MKEYAIVLLFFFLVTVYIDSRYKIHLHRKTHVLLAFAAIWVLIALIIDELAVVRHWWAFPNHGVYMGFVGNIPVEEIIFALVIPYYFVVLWKYLEHKNA